ncbi:hypothetical protein B0H16DRAFT_1888341 [Mycena metata]|uniref:Uncharacterized protein n=1 Tax=Mycena metata TaxID=1033252 RepID=A0AAD7N702_9AGAR|nr:hypothetical protein B0H16DRAFT_1888341 [Mycena metata]
MGSLLLSLVLAELNVTAPQSSIDAFVTFTYAAEAAEDAAKLCYYFPNRTLFNGSTVSCPELIGNFGFLCLSFDGSPSNPPEETTTRSLARTLSLLSKFLTINSARLNSTGFNCPLNCTNQTLIGASITLEHNLACTYTNTTAIPSLCLYDPHGATLNATSTPSSFEFSIISSSSNNESTGASGNNTGNPCLQLNKSGASLASSSISHGPDRMASCTYADNIQCTYLSINGTLKVGPSTCPPSIAPTAPVGALPSGRHLLAAAAASTGTSASSKNKLHPALTALLAMSIVIVLVVGLLVLLIT